MERVGGGGHLNVAGAQLTNCTIQEAKRMIQDTIDEMIKKEIFRNESNIITGCKSFRKKGDVVNVSDGYARNAIFRKN